MALLSTLRPLPQRLLERLWLILSGYVPTSIEYHMTMNALNDDCLLILLDTLTMPQLLQLRGVSRRLCQLIERQCLGKFRTLIFAYEEKNEEKRDQELTGEGTIQLYFASRMDADRELGLESLFFWHRKTPTLPASKLVSLRSKDWPLSLPRLLPCLSSLTLTHFLVDQVEAPSEEQLAVNRLFVLYLNSNWSSTLTTLHLFIHVSPKPEPDNSSFAQLNQLINLQHFILEFSRFPYPESSPCLLPDSMPVFCQLLSFSLRFYGGSNAVTLLHQLGHHLSILSLDEINCTEDDYIAFLRARPNYARTLKTFDVNLSTTSWSLFTEATQNLASLEDFGFTSSHFPQSELDFFTDLSNLRHLQSIHWVSLSVAQLRALHLRQHMPGTLPRLSNIRHSAIIIHHREEENGDPFQPNELFDRLLPLVFAVFCSLEKLTIHFCQGRGRRHEESLSVKLYTKVFQLAPSLQRLTAVYLVE